MMALDIVWQNLCVPHTTCRTLRTRPDGGPSQDITYKGDCPLFVEKGPQV